MATDPGMLQSWYADYKADKGADTTQPAAITGAAAPAPAPTTGGMLASAGGSKPFTAAQATTTEWKPNADATVAGQVNKIPRPAAR